MIGPASRVPLARCTLLQDRRRTLLATFGVAAALLLVLMLQSVFDGSIRQTTTYLRSSPADVFVSQRDVRTMHMSVSLVPPDTAAVVARVEGVAWAEPIGFTTTFLTAPGGTQQLSYVIGYDTTTGRAGPRHLTRGTPPRTGEILLERVAADRLHVRIGDDVSVFGTAFRVSGIFRGGTTITNSIAFIPSGDFATRHGPVTAYVLVGARPGTSAHDLAERLALALPQLTVQTRSGFARQEASLVTDMGADLMQIMSLVALLIAQAVIALTLYSLTLANLRAHAIVKALGAPTRRVAAVVIAQAWWSIALAVLTATTLAIGLAALIPRLDPAIALSIEPASVTRVAFAALVVGGVGALVPLRRVVALDPADAFRRPS